jgi:hypothetical protein
MNGSRIAPLKALFLAAGAGLALGGASWALHRSMIASLAVAFGVAVMLFVMFAFPDAANRQLWGRSKPSRTSVTPRQVVLRVGLVGLGFIAIAIWLQSWLVALVAVCYLLFWAAMIYFNRSRLRA